MRPTAMQREEASNPRDKRLLTSVAHTGRGDYKRRERDQRSVRHELSPDHGGTLSRRGETYDGEKSPFEGGRPIFFSSPALLWRGVKDIHATRYGLRFWGVAQKCMYEIVFLGRRLTRPHKVC